MELSGYSLPNIYISVTLDALGELMGVNGLRSLLNAAGLAEWIQAPPAPDDGRDIDFNQSAILFRTLADLYGPKGTKSLMRRANIAVFDRVWSGLKSMTLTVDPEFRKLEQNLRIERGLTTFTQTLMQTSDIHAKVDRVESGLRVMLECCPYCWDSTSESPQCFAFIGLLERAVCFFVPEAKVEIEETECIAAGDAHCSFILKFQS